MNLVSISYGLKMVFVDWTDLEMSLSAVARTKSFEEKTLSENKAGESSTPQPPWPRTGHLRLKSVSARYDMSEKGGFALRHSSIDIPRGQMVVICGRSVSGKSSLVYHGASTND